MRKPLALGMLLILAVCTVAQQQRFDGQSWRHHIEVLAADDMQGRGTGTPGLDRAETYVVDQLKKSGLAPAGVNGYFQPVKLMRREIGENDCSAALVRSGKAQPLALGQDAACTTFVDIAPRVEAPLVFLGYGLQVPQAKYDDFTGLDLKGKIAVTIPGSPESVDDQLRADYERRRWDQYRKAGLIGWIFITGQNFPWASLPVPWPFAESRLHFTGQLDQTHDEQIMMYFNPARADKLFDGTGHTAAELFALAKDRKPLPHFALPVSLRATARTVNTPVESANIVAKLEGSEPQLKNEYVVISAHVDGQGGKASNDNRLYPSAIDNASGVAALLDIATELKKEGAKPKRSVLFAFFTAEEQGELGSKYFVAHPSVSLKSMVANLNIDEVHANVPLKAVRTLLGQDGSDLDDAASRASASQGITFDSEAPLDPAAFSSSDQYTFALLGIPAVHLMVAFPGELGPVFQKYRRDVHHTPFDDLHQPVNLETAAKFEEVALRLLLDVANDPHRPEWKASSFYKRYATR